MDVFPAAFFVGQTSVMIVSLILSETNKTMPWQSRLLIFILITFSYSASATSDESQVVIKKFKFIPQEITIKRGETVQWVNQEKRQYHNVWFEASGEEEPDDYLFPDDSYEREFKEVGSFPYRCGPHPEMTGIVHVIN